MGSVFGAVVDTAFHLEERLWLSWQIKFHVQADRADMTKKLSPESELN